MNKRNVGLEILEGIQAIKRGEGKQIEVAEPDVKSIRTNMGLTQSAFAALLGVSLRTLQDWEQGRRTPTGPAKSLLRVADKHPEALLA
ncbi:MAG: helix-turn-helix domain-containing protein [Desulfuromonadaceae bacterium]